MTERFFQELEAIIQEDPGGRGLRADSKCNLVTAAAGGLESACRSIAAAREARVGIVTGFNVPTEAGPRPETDGPPGAVFLARALTAVGVPVVLAAESEIEPALLAGLRVCGLEGGVSFVRLHGPVDAQEMGIHAYREAFATAAGPLTHLVAIERLGPSHTAESVRGQPCTTEETHRLFETEITPDQRGRCLSARGIDMTAMTGPAWWLFEPPVGTCRTIGIGDGGNEIGMGKIPWPVIRRNVRNGGLIASRVATDDLIVCGVSNWGAYALGVGVAIFRGLKSADRLCDPETQSRVLEAMVNEGGLVDGHTGRSECTVDGLPFERHAEVLKRIGAAIA